MQQRQGNTPKPESLFFTPVFINWCMLELQAESCPLNSQAPEHCSWLLYLMYTQREVVLEWSNTSFTYTRKLFMIYGGISIACTRKVFSVAVAPYLHTPELFTIYGGTGLLCMHKKTVLGCSGTSFTYTRRLLLLVSGTSFTCTRRLFLVFLSLPS